MKVKDVSNPIGKKVINPNTGKIGYFKGYFNEGIFISTHNTNIGVTYPIYIKYDDFIEWEITSEKITIKKPKK
jgi:hypothetical protein